MEFSFTERFASNFDKGSKLLRKVLKKYSVSPKVTNSLATAQASGFLHSERQQANVNETAASLMKVESFIPKKLEGQPHMKHLRNILEAALYLTQNAKIQGLNSRIELDLREKEVTFETSLAKTVRLDVLGMDVLRTFQSTVSAWADKMGQGRGAEIKTIREINDQGFARIIHPEIGTNNYVDQKVKTVINIDLEKNGLPKSAQITIDAENLVRQEGMGDLFPKSDTADVLKEMPKALVRANITIDYKEDVGIERKAKKTFQVSERNFHFLEGQGLNNSLSLQIEGERFLVSHETSDNLLYTK